MSKNSVFNASICIIGILILLVHIINIVLKKEKRRDEKNLLLFCTFTALHFLTYFIFTLLKVNHTSNNFIIAFYTTFYIMNNIEVFLLYVYMSSYTELSGKIKKWMPLLNVTLFSIFVLLDITNIFTGMFFYARNGEYLRNRAMIVSQGYQFVMFISIFFASLFNKRLNLREKNAFALYCLLPFIAIILQNFFKGYAIAYASIIISIEILFAFLGVEKNLELAKQKEKNKEAQIKVMLSQIQPHFIYNSLSAISTLIKIEPDKAQRTLDDFTEYLRRNLSSLTEEHLIHFDDELRHIKTYVSLEKVRFNERVNVIYDIQTTDFFVPSLSIQPIVENAIKHGILKKVEGGKVIIKAYETVEAYVVEVIDDGVGFDTTAGFDKGNEHLGINNIKYRIKNMCNGDIIINSEKEKGTQVIVKFLK